MSKSSSLSNRVDPFFLEFEDDCAICRAEAQAQRAGRELTIEELDEAFLQAGREGAIVGTDEDLMNEDDDEDLKY